MWWLILTVTQWDLESLRRLTSECVCVYESISRAVCLRWEDPPWIWAVLSHGLRSQVKWEGERSGASASISQLLGYSCSQGRGDLAWFVLHLLPLPCCDGLHSSLGLCWHSVPIRKVAKTMGSLSTYVASSSFIHVFSSPEQKSFILDYFFSLLLL